MLTVELMHQCAIEAVEHMAQANWSNREEAAKDYLNAIFNEQLDADLDTIQKEINES